MWSLVRGSDSIMLSWKELEIFTYPRDRKIKFRNPVLATWGDSYSQELLITKILKKLMVTSVGQFHNGFVLSAEFLIFKYGLREMVSKLVFRDSQPRSNRSLYQAGIFDLNDGQKNDEWSLPRFVSFISKGHRN